MVGICLELIVFMDYGRKVERGFTRKNNPGKHKAPLGELHANCKLTIFNNRIYLMGIKFCLLVVQQMNINKGRCQEL